MKQVKPICDNYQCPECNSSNTKINKNIIQGMHVFADCECDDCGLKYYKLVPVGHRVGYDIAIDKSSGKLYNDENSSWLKSYLRNYIQSIRTEEVNITKIVYHNATRIIIINALDFLYGHCLLKLYNAQYHFNHHPDFGLVVLIPRNFEWLIPTGCAEAWIVDLKLGDFRYGYSSIERQILNEFDRFQEIHFSNAYSHPDFTNIDIKRFTGIEPFNLTNFYKTKVTVTFVLREDRFWLENPLARLFHSLFKKIRQLKLARRVLARRQEALVRSTIRSIRKKIPDSAFFVVGLGKSRGLYRYAEDRRSESVNSTIEKEWCLIYSRSHVVIGIHGSNMLLPTALAASCVEVLPEDRFDNIVQDISVRYADRRQLFMYRFADQFSTPRNVGQKAVSIIKDYDGFYKNMCENIYKEPTELVAGHNAL